MNDHFNPRAIAVRLPKRSSSNRGGVVIRIGRQIRVNLTVGPAYFQDIDARRITSPYRYPIAYAGQRKAQHVEADAGIAD